MTDEQRKQRDEAAEDFCKGAGNVALASTDFKAGADYWHARAKVLEEALEVVVKRYEETGDETKSKFGVSFGVYSVAREALATYRRGGA